MSGFLYAVFFGAPYVPTFSQDIDELMGLAKVGKGTQFVDLGCGDGKLLLAAAQRGAHATGYEINPMLWLICKWRLRTCRASSKVYLRSMWRADIAGADVMFLYLHTKWMDKMERKLRAEGKQGARVVSYVFTFDGLKQTHKTRNAYIYEL